MQDFALWYTVAVLVAAMVLFALDRIRLDLVGLGALLALVLGDVLEVEEALAGFGDSVVVMIAALFVVGEGLFQTGIAASIGRWPARLAGRGEARLVLVMMAMVALMSGFISSTGTVAVMLPVAAGLAADRGLSPSRLLMPLSVASLLGGMLTLVGTPPNLVVSGQLTAIGREPFGFFAFAPIGLAACALGMVWLVFFGRRVLVDRIPAPGGGPGGESATRAVLLARYGLQDRVFTMVLPAGCALDGQTVREADLRNRFGVTLLDLRMPATERVGVEALLAVPRRRPTSKPRPVLPDERFCGGELARVVGRVEHVERMAEALGLRITHRSAEGELDLPPEVGLAEVLLTPRSRLLDHTVEELAFREKYRVTVLGVRRMGAPVPSAPATVRLRFGDTLLVKGPWSRIALLAQERRDFVVISDSPEARVALRPRHKAPLAAIIVGLTMLSLTLGWTPAVISVLLGALALVLTGCVPVGDSYRAISWPSVVLVAAMLPMATALQKSGALALAVDGFATALQGAGVRTGLLAFFALTSLLSQVISNTATAVLLAPMGVQVAALLGASPEPFLMTIAVGASTAFSTPMASPVNTLVAGPGGYTFRDFLRVGVPLQLMVGALAVLLIPWLFP